MNSIRLTNATIHPAVFLMQDHRGQVPSKHTLKQIISSLIILHCSQSHIYIKDLFNDVELTDICSLLLAAQVSKLRPCCHLDSVNGALTLQ